MSETTTTTTTTTAVETVDVETAVSGTTGQTATVSEAAKPLVMELYSPTLNNGQVPINQLCGTRAEALQLGEVLAQQNNVPVVEVSLRTWVLSEGLIDAMATRIAEVRSQSVQARA